MQNKIDSRHPILTQEYAIFTPPMQKMINIIGDWIDHKVCGGYIYGPSRFGKSRTVKWYLKQELEERFKSYLPMIVWIRRDSIMTEAEFWNQLLLASNYDLLDIHKPKNRIIARSIFEERVKTFASYADCNYAVLVIDEAHEVTLKEWKWLLGLQNSLDYSGIRLSVFSIASHNILYQPNYLSRTGNPHIAARFFAADFRFSGIKKIEELHYILQSYDEDSEWPAGSNISYTQYFLPISNISCKLSDYTEVIWRAFEDLFPPELNNRIRNKIPLEIPMQHIALTVEKFLRIRMKIDDIERFDKVDFWLDIIASTGFSKHIQMIANPV